MGLFCAFESEGLEELASAKASVEVDELCRRVVPLYQHDVYDRASFLDTGLRCGTECILQWALYNRKFFKRHVEARWPGSTGKILSSQRLDSVHAGSRANPQFEQIDKRSPQSVSNAERTQYRHSFQETVPVARQLYRLGRIANRLATMVRWQAGLQGARWHCNCDRLLPCRG